MKKRREKEKEKLMLRLTDTLRKERSTKNVTSQPETLSRITCLRLMGFELTQYFSYIPFTLMSVKRVEKGKPSPFGKFSESFRDKFLEF